MGSTLFGQQINATYDGLIKTSDSAAISDTAKYVGDGLGNDSPLALSTSKLGINNLAPTVMLQITENTNNIETLRVDNAGGNLGSVQGISHLGLSFFSVGDNSPVRLTAYQNGVSGWPGGFALSTRNDNADVAPTEKLRVTSDGALLVGSTTKGSAGADVVQRNGNMFMLSRTNAAVAASGTSTILVTNTTAGYQGLLVVAVTGVNDPNLRTQSTYSIFGKGSDFVATEISSADGLTGPASFTITSPSQGFITVTNTDATEAVDIYMQFFGGLSA